MSIGTEDQDWPSVVRAASEVIVDWAVEGQYGSYSELTGAVNERVTDAELQPYGRNMNWLLHDVVMRVREFDPQGPILSAVVVYADRDNRRPGEGFFELATELGEYSGSRDPSDRDAFWGQQLQSAFERWTRTRRREFERWGRATAG